MWDSATPTSVDFADGAYFHNFETLRYFATGSGNDSITQPPNIEKIIFLGSATLPSLDIGPGQIVIVGGAAPPPAPPVSALPAADSGLNEIARWQAMAGTVSDALQIGRAHV